MTPQQALDMLFQMTTTSPMPLTAHLQAKQAHTLLSQALASAGEPQAKVATIKKTGK